MKWGLVALALLFACNRQATFQVGPTTVHYVDFAMVYPDTNETLWRSRNCLNQNGLPAHEILSIDLIIHGPGAQIQTPRDSLGYGREFSGHLIAGSYWDGEIQIVQRPAETRLIDSAFLHELLEHRVPDVVDGTKNEQHDPKVKEKAANLETCIREVSDA